MNEVKLIRTIANQLIIGKVNLNGEYYVIETPYTLVPEMDGIKLYPFDSELIGKELEFAEVHKSSTLYATEPGTDIKNAYLQSISGIETEPKKQLII